MKMRYYIILERDADQDDIEFKPYKKEIEDFIVRAFDSEEEQGLQTYCEIIGMHLVESGPLQNSISTKWTHDFALEDRKEG